MLIRVDYVDPSKHRTQLAYAIGKLGLGKHLAVAGQRFAPSATKLFRGIGLLLLFNPYLRRECLDLNYFSLPPPNLSDPTEKAQFSNFVGKGIADFLAKRIDNCIYTTTYEAAMRVKGISVTGRRPDLLAFSPPRTTISMEAKGRSRGPGNMADHKHQAAATDPALPTNLSVACVSYNLYEQVEVNYYDPYNESIPFDDELFSHLTSDYYRGLLGFLMNDSFRIEEVILENETFFEVSIRPPEFLRLFRLTQIAKCFQELIEHYNPRILLPSGIKEFAKDGLPRNLSHFEFRETEEIYIDRDRVGVRINSQFPGHQKYRFPQELKRKASFR